MHDRQPPPLLSILCVLRYFWPFQRHPDGKKSLLRIVLVGWVSPDLHMYLGDFGNTLGRSNSGLTGLGSLRFDLRGCTNTPPSTLQRNAWYLAADRIDFPFPASRGRCRSTVIPAHSDLPGPRAYWKILEDSLRVDPGSRQPAVNDALPGAGCS